MKAYLIITCTLVAQEPVCLTTRTIEWSVHALAILLRSVPMEESAHLT